jgi:hypothetical protein
LIRLGVPTQPVACSISTVLALNHPTCDRLTRVAIGRALGAVAWPWAADATECGARDVRPDLQTVARGLSGALIASTPDCAPDTLPLTEALEELAATHFE